MKHRTKYNKYFIAFVIIGSIWLIISRLKLSGQIIYQEIEVPQDKNQLIGLDKSKEIDETDAKKTVKYDFLKRYPQLLDCKNDYNKWSEETAVAENGTVYNYSRSASSEYHSNRILRAVIVYFPIDSLANFEHELRWLYRSWIHMMQYEPSKWRTDLVIFTENDPAIFNRSDFFLNALNCKFENLRTSPEQKPMCTLLNYVALEKRNLTTISTMSSTNPDELYSHLLNDVDVFSSSLDVFDTLRFVLKKEIGKYRYLNSILMALEGYEYFKKAGYDFLIRSDMDVFLTPLFGTWLPRHCNDFNVGRGAFSTDFNEKRLSRAANRIGLEYAFWRNLGSTWYSTPTQIRLVAYLTLFGMVYVAQEEFSETEREGKIGVQLWPFWHYGVLLLYGQSVGLNHLIATKQINVVKLQDYLDYPSGNSYSIHRVLHIHVFHGDDLFSKFAFKMGKYDNMTVSDSDEIKLYALRMALEGKRFSCENLYLMLASSSINKN